MSLLKIERCTQLPGVEINNISGSQQDYLAENFCSPPRYLVVRKWPRFKQNNMTKTLKNIHNFAAVTILGSQTEFLVVIRLPDYHYFDPC